MRRFWKCIVLAWLDEMLRNFLWVPLAAHVKILELDSELLGPLFALNVGFRMLPNFLVTQVGTFTEVPMMGFVVLGYVLSCCFPSETWALFALAAAGGLGFVRPCVTLHSQAACQGDIDSFTLLSQRCGAARTCADVCSFALPSAVFQCIGWVGVTVLGASLGLLYLVLVLPMYFALNGLPSLQEEAPAESSSIRNVMWIDWVMSAAFIGTEIQWNMLNSVVPATLVHSYGCSTVISGALVGFGSLIAMGYLVMLPSLPRFFNQPRPTNLLITYTTMSLSWLAMVVSCTLPQFAPVFVGGLWMFLAMANASQVVLLECLTGVVDPQTSSRIMGLSEVGGCVAGMAGSYAGAALASRSISAPFVWCSSGSFICAVMLALALGRRRTQVTGGKQWQPEQPSDGWAAAEAEAEIPRLEGAQIARDIEDEPLLSQSVRGLNEILVGDRTTSYIGPEVEFRREAHS